jgi:hypothetical protein
VAPGGEGVEGFGHPLRGRVKPPPRELEPAPASCSPALAGRWRTPALAPIGARFRALHPIPWSLMGRLRAPAGGAGRRLEVNVDQLGKGQAGAREAAPPRGPGAL